MDNDVRRYYEDLYRRPPRRAQSGLERLKQWLARTGTGGEDEPYRGAGDVTNSIRRTIERAEHTVLGGRGLRLREDARLLLLLNGEYMIAGPIIEAGRLPTGEVLSDLEQDIGQVLNAVDPHDHEVSGYDVIDSLARQRKDLRTSRLSVWDT
jgi:hypothetical protein